MRLHPDEVNMNTLAKTIPKVYEKYRTFFSDIKPERVIEL